MNKLDTRPWNIGLPLVLVAACGRTLPLLPSEEESETDTEDPSGVTIDPTEPTNPTVDPDECRTSEDCPPGYYCGEGNQCIEYYDYCDDGDCCWDGCCYDGCHYYECYSDYECGEGYECRYYECVPEEGPQPCADIPIAFSEPELLLEYGGEINLAFVEAPGIGNELAIASDGVVQIIGSEYSLVLAEALPAEGLAVGDLEGDGDEDVVVLAPSGLYTFISESNGSFTVGPHTETVDASNGSLALGDFDGDLELDAFIRLPDSTLRYAGVGDGTFIGGETIAPGTCGFTVSANPQSPAFDDVYYGEGGQAWYAQGNAEGFQAYTIGGKLSGDLCPIDAGDFDADGLADAAVLDASGTGLVTTWWAIGAEQASGVWSPPAYHTNAAMVDLDLDGRDDLALSGSKGDLTVRFGSTDFDEAGQPLGCYVMVPIGAVPESASFGDFDGDGDRDLVGTDGNFVWIASANL